MTPVGPKPFPEPTEAISPPAPGEPSAAEAAGARAASNTILRSSGEILGKVASLVLFAVLARVLGQSELGIFVLALAFVQVATMPIALGLDRYMLRQIAGQRERLGEHLYKVLALKAGLAVPVLVATVLVANLVGYDTRTREAIYILFAGVLLETLARSLLAVFEAFERGGLLAVALFVQRFAAAALGLAALLAGYGVVTIALTYTLAVVLSIVFTVALFARRIGFPRHVPEGIRWQTIALESIPFAAQDVFGALLFRIDTVMLSLLATAAAVGRYGAAYRLFESTLFFTWALVGSFAPMFVYLTADSDPPLRAAFGRSIKAALAVLTPCALIFSILAVPLSRLFFGADFVAASGALRLLGPVVVLLAVVALCSSIIVSRGRPTLMVWYTGAAATLNIVLNVVLIPISADVGAALAMLVTEVAFGLLVVPKALRLAGGIDWWPTLAAPVAAGAAMAPALLLLLPVNFVLALGAGVVVYAAVFAAVERIVSPVDLQFILRFLRGRLLPRAS